MAAIACLCMVSACGGSQAAAVRLQPAGAAQPHPFTPATATNDSDVHSIANGSWAVQGNSPGLYGGSASGIPPCDRQKLIAYLVANPAAATAWAGVEGITASDAPAYISSLTPAFLRSDTMLEDYSY